MGECLFGLQKPEQAMTLWTQFLKALPAGPWRGQARVAVADLLLDQLDLAGATDQIRQAAAVLDNLPPGADSSWPEAAPDIRLRQGILALLSQQYDAAVTALDLATRSPRLPGEGQGVRAGANDLLKFAAKKQPLVPAELGATIVAPGLALGLARIAVLMGRKDQAAALFTSVQAGRIKGTTAIQASFACQGVARAYGRRTTFCTRRKPTS